MTLHLDPRRPWPICIASMRLQDLHQRRHGVTSSVWPVAGLELLLLPVEFPLVRDSREQFALLIEDFASFGVTLLDPPILRNLTKDRMVPQKQATVRNSNHREQSLAHHTEYV